MGRSGDIYQTGFACRLARLTLLCSLALSPVLCETAGQVWLLRVLFLKAEPLVSSEDEDEEGKEDAKTRSCPRHTHCKRPTSRHLCERTLQSLHSPALTAPLPCEHSNPARAGGPGDGPPVPLRC
jgi:hypothetical protein